jgi:hypothetical protein
MIQSLALAGSTLSFAKTGKSVPAESLRTEKRSWLVSRSRAPARSSTSMRITASLRSVPPAEIS